MALSARRAAALSASAGLLVPVLACGVDTGSDPGVDNPAAAGIDCAPYKKYGDLDGETVEVYTSEVAPEDKPHIESWVPFESCTGADVVYEGSQEFETQLVVRAQSGNPPDIAYIPQPGLLEALVRSTDVAVPASNTAEANVDRYFTEDWRRYGTVDDTFYGVPLTATVKSMVWYDPQRFEKAGYDVPKTMDDLLETSQDIAADGGVPWCEGINSGDATGWPLTDWLEDLVLREHGPEVYDAWVSHQIPFDDPRIASSLERVGGIVRNPAFVNGGFGGVQSVASTPEPESGLPILDGQCWFHRQGSFYKENWPKGTEIAPDGDVFAFHLPPTDPAMGLPLLGGGEFAVAFSDDPAVQAFQAFLASPQWANLMGEPTANSGFHISRLSSPVDRLGTKLLQDKDAVFRFDGSDMMPAEVGAGTFWSEITAWVATGKPTAEVLGVIEDSWPD